MSYFIMGAIFGALYAYLYNQTLTEEELLDELFASRAEPKKEKHEPIPQ